MSSSNNEGCIIVIEKKEYSLAEIPSFNDPLVQREKERVLGKVRTSS